MYDFSLEVNAKGSVNVALANQTSPFSLKL